MTHRTWTRALRALALGLCCLAPALEAQNPTGTITGRVTDASGDAIPGVTISASSPSLQGVRSTQSGINGDYKLAFLPAGEYAITYELEGFATATRQVSVRAAQTVPSDVRLELATITEEIVVTSVSETISQSLEGATSVPQDELEKLPVLRTVDQALRLAPGVTDSGYGPNGEPSIGGAMTFQNLYLVNGVVINENIRGSLLPLFIEDAIQETTTTTSSVSAEYGRFTGGVVNALTKSGGNQFDGSFRTSFNNDDWQGEVPADEPHFSGSPEREDKVNEIYEATLGGYLWRDHVWFFGAGRDRELSESGQTFVTNIQFPVVDTETRFEGKLTLSPNANHSLIGSYLDIERETENYGAFRFMDLDSLTNRKDPQEIKAANYTGILTSNLFVEAQYSEREYQIGVGAGGPPDQILGTVHRIRGRTERFFSPTFCGSCEDEFRNNENWLAKASYFLSTESFGTHDIAAGYDTFEDSIFSINHQTGSDFTVWASDIIVGPDNTIYPRYLGTSTWIGWFAVFNQDIARPSSFETNSFYVNDRWQLNDRWSFNVGVRYDQNDGKNSAGVTVADDDKVSPRLGASFDVAGDGDLVVNASYGTYVSALNSSGNVGDASSNGGAIGLFLSSYGGPLINTDPNCAAAGTCTSTADALRILYDWYFANGGTRSLDDDLSSIPGLFYTSIPGVTTVVPDTFQSPSADEWVLGATKRLGGKGLVRADLVYREWEDFYSNRTPGVIVSTPAGPADLVEVGNFGEDVLQREYIGLQTQFRYRVSDRFTLAGNYTLSQTEGNIDGETESSGAVPFSPNVYPELRQESWNYPTGDLSTDQRHTARAWGIYDLVDTENHVLSVSWLENYFSGNPYGAVGNVDAAQYVTTSYATPPESFFYYFTSRDAFRTDDIHRSDLALNYSFRFSAIGQDFEIFLQPEVINVFDENAEIEVDQTIFDATNCGSGCADYPEGFAEFDPFTETPVEGVHWGKGSDFGHATGEEDYQQPRTFRFSVGFRF